MKPLLTLIVGAVLVGLPSPSLAQATKTVSGTITTVTVKSLGVRVGDKDMAFAVDAKSDVVTPGMTPRIRKSIAAGSGPTLAELVRPGQTVEVKYRETGMYAVTIRLLAVRTEAELSRPRRATGVVSAVTPGSLNMTGGGGDWTFVVDAKTEIDGPGVETTKRQKAAAGAKVTITDLVAAGDTVLVRYHLSERLTKQADLVRVTGKGG